MQEPVRVPAAATPLPRAERDAALRCLLQTTLQNLLRVIELEIDGRRLDGQRIEFATNPLPRRSRRIGAGAIRDDPPAPEQPATAALGRGRGNATRWLHPPQAPPPRQRPAGPTAAPVRRHESARHRAALPGQAAPADGLPPSPPRPAAPPRPYPLMYFRSEEPRALLLGDLLASCLRLGRLGEAPDGPPATGWSLEGPPPLAGRRLHRPGDDPGEHLLVLQGEVQVLLPDRPPAGAAGATLHHAAAGDPDQDPPLRPGEGETPLPPDELRHERDPHLPGDPRPDAPPAREDGPPLLQHHDQRRAADRGDDRRPRIPAALRAGDLDQQHQPRPAQAADARPPAAGGHRLDGPVARAGHRLPGEHRRLAGVHPRRPGADPARPGPPRAGGGAGLPPRLQQVLLGGEALRPRGGLAGDRQPHPPPAAGAARPDHPPPLDLRGACLRRVPQPPLRPGGGPRLAGRGRRPPPGDVLRRANNINVTTGPRPATCWPSCTRTAAASSGWRPSGKGGRWR